MTRVMLVDRSGRGHALADLFVRTNENVEVLYAPGCTAITHDRIKSFPALNLTDMDGLIKVAKDYQADFALISNAAGLANGYVNAFWAAGIPAIGPDKEASKLESSKSYAKNICAKYGVPVADFAIFTDPHAAKEYINQVGYDVVVKADGLCGGGGSYVCSSVSHATSVVDELMIEKVHGDAGNTIVVEKKLPGIELSFFALYDGKSFAALPMALDYKRADDGNVGVNGGGMGAISPHPLESDELTEMLHVQILKPLAAAINGEGLNYKGPIYIGSMLSEGSLKVLEINVRLGDPETEAVAPRIQSDFTEVCLKVLGGQLSQSDIIVSPQFSCNVVATQGKTQQLTAEGRSKGWYKGWPYGRYGKGYPISGLENIDGQCKVFFGEAAHSLEKGLVSDGGRVIHVVGMGLTREESISLAYQNIRHVVFEGTRNRNDIGTIYDDTAVVLESDLQKFMPK